MFVYLIVRVRVYHRVCVIEGVLVIVYVSLLVPVCESVCHCVCLCVSLCVFVIVRARVCLIVYVC